MTSCTCSRHSALPVHTELFYNSFLHPYLRDLSSYFVFLFKSPTHWFLLVSTPSSSLHLIFHSTLSIPHSLPFEYFTSVYSFPLASFIIKALPQPCSLPGYIGSLMGDIVKWHVITLCAMFFLPRSKRALRRPHAELWSLLVTYMSKCINKY